MKYTVLTLFPEIIDAYFSTSIMAKAVNRGIVEYKSVNIRDFARDKHHTCDDAPYGGGAGMLMLAEPLGLALEAAGARIRSQKLSPKDESEKTNSPETVPANEAFVPKTIYLSPSGKPLNQALARKLATQQELILICGRYEGIDQRIIDSYVDEEISAGDYVLSSGEVAAMVLIDATYRLIDNVITPQSLEEESFSSGLLEYPQYTRPEIYDTIRVPEVLLSGHHEQIRRWRLRKRIEKTLEVRPDLIRHGLDRNCFDVETTTLIKEIQDKPQGSKPEVDS